MHKRVRNTGRGDADLSVAQSISGKQSQPVNFFFPKEIGLIHHSSMMVKLCTE